MPEYTRQQLYDLVWSRPSNQIAAEIGVTKAVFTAFCREHQIPKPSSLHWTLVAAGRPSEPTPLPAMEDRDKTIRIDPTPPRSRRSEMLAPGEEVIVVPPKLESPLPCIRATDKALRSTKPQYGLLFVKGHNVLEVNVSIGSIDRAMLIMDTLLKAIKNRGLKVVVDEEHKWSTLITCEEEVFALRMGGGSVERPRQLTAQQQRENAKYEHYKPHAESEKVGGGSLVITVRHEDDPYIEQRWSEKDGKALEGRLNAVIAFFAKGAARRRERRAEHAARDLRWKEESRLREIEAERKRREEEKIKQLNAEVTSWHEAERIRAYVAAVERNADANGRPIQDGRDLAEWIAWARRRADIIDPLHD